MKFTEEQISFLEKEFGLKEEALPQLTRKQWVELQEKCFDIEVHEVIAADGGNGPVSERGMIAVRIVDYINNILLHL